MFNLNFDICLVPFRAILTEITVFKLKRGQLFPILGPHFVGTNLHTREYFQLIGTSICVRQMKHNLRELREAIATACRNLKQQMIQNSFDSFDSRARRCIRGCIRAGGHAFTDEHRRLFLNHKRERTDNKV